MRILVRAPITPVVRTRNIYVPLTESAAAQLRELARRELRDPRTQAAYLILVGLRAAGLDPEPAPEEHGRQA